MYSIVSFVSLIVRQFLLPNPYLNYFPDKNIAELFNIIAGGAILHFLSFWITGIYYSKGDAPTLGSISYLFWYIINTAIITLAGCLIKNIYLLIFSLIVIYLIIVIIIIKISNKFNF